MTSNAKQTCSDFLHFVQQAKSQLRVNAPADQFRSFLALATPLE